MNNFTLFICTALIIFSTNVFASTVYTKINACDTGYVGYEHYTVWHNTPVNTHTYSAVPDTHLSLFRWSASSGEVQGTSERRAFLKFDLSDISALGIDPDDIMSITLGITYASGHNYAPNANIAVYNMSGTVTSGILVSDFDKIGSTVRMIEPAEVYRFALFEMDVTSLINLNDDYEGFIVRYLSGNDTWGHDFYGKSDPTYFPYLQIEYNLIPEPATLLLLALGAVGLIRKNKK